MTSYTLAAVIIYNFISLVSSILEWRDDSQYKC